MKLIQKVAVVGLLTLLAACSSVNPFSRKVPESQMPASLQDFEQSMAVRTLWNVSVGDAGAYSFEPALAHGSVFAAAEDGSVVRVSVARRPDGVAH